MAGGRGHWLAQDEIEAGICALNSVLSVTETTHILSAINNNKINYIQLLLLLS